MSFGEGNLRERCDELERDNAELRKAVRLFRRSEAMKIQHINELEWLIRHMWNVADFRACPPWYKDEFKDRMHELGIEVGE